MNRISLLLLVVLLAACAGPSPAPHLGSTPGSAPIQSAPTAQTPPTQPEAAQPPSAATQALVPTSAERAATESSAQTGLKSVEYAGVSFQYDSSLAKQVNAETKPAFIQESGYIVDTVPQRVVFTFNDPYTSQGVFAGLSPANYPWQAHQLVENPDPWAARPQIFIFPVEEFVQSNPDAGQETSDLAAVLFGADPASLDELPALPLFPCRQSVRAGIRPVGFENGQGIRYLAACYQDASPVVNPNLYYSFQGLTNDGQLYVAAYFPVYAPVLPDAPPDLSDMDAWMLAYPDYLQETNQALDTTPDSQFTPDLALLDSLVQSLSLTWQPSP